MVTRDNVIFSDGTRSISISTNNVKEAFVNPVRIFTQPNLNEGERNTTSSLNLNKIENRFIINGSLIEGQQHYSDTKTTAYDKKLELKKIFSKGSVVSMTWEGDVYSVSVDKYEIEYAASDNPTDENDGEIVYDVIITAIITEDII